MSRSRASTFTINVTGCFAAGVVVAAFVDRQHLPPWLRAAVVIGVLGGYTTFSTFAQEALSLLEEEQLGLALVYSLGSVLAAVSAVFVGTVVGRML